MKKIILILTFLISFLISYSQLTVQVVYAGQYAIRTIGTSDYIAKFPGNGTITYMAGITSVSVVDTVFYVQSTSSLDTLANFIRPSGETAAIVFQRNGTWTGTIVVTQDSMVYTSYGGGTNPIIEFYANALEGSSIVVKNLTIGNILTAMLTEEGDYMITEEGYLMVEEY